MTLCRGKSKSLHNWSFTKGEKIECKFAEDSAISNLWDQWRGLAQDDEGPNHIYVQFQWHFFLSFYFSSISSVYVFLHHNKRCKLDRTEQKLFGKEIYWAIFTKGIESPILSSVHAKLNIYLFRKIYLWYIQQYKLQYLHRGIKSPILSKNFLWQKWFSIYTKGGWDHLSWALSTLSRLLSGEACLVSESIGTCIWIISFYPTWFTKHDLSI